MEKDVRQDTDSDSEDFQDALDDLVLQSGLNDSCEAPKQPSPPSDDKPSPHSDDKPLPSGDSKDSERLNTDQIVNEVIESAKSLDIGEDASSDTRPTVEKEGVSEDNFEEDSGEESSDENCDTKKNRIVVEEERLQERDSKLTDDEKQELKNRAVELKNEGNTHFKETNFAAAVVSYTDAIQTCPLCFVKERSIMYSNRSACKLHLEQNDDAIEDCSKALELHPDYLKCLMRRAELYEKTEKLDEALADYQELINKGSSEYMAVSRAASVRLDYQIKERNEKLKEEMMGKLKDLGNLVLRPFGLSTNNFNLQQNSETGGYSVQFQQNPANGN